MFSLIITLYSLNLSHIEFRKPIDVAPFQSLVACEAYKKREGLESSNHLSFDCVKND